MARRKKANNLRLGILLLLIALIVVVLLWPSCINERETANEYERTTLVKIGDTAPEFTFEGIDGNQSTFSQYRDGRVALLTFWVSTCPDCRAELARVGQDIVARFAGEDFVFLAVNRGETREAVQAFRAANGYTFPMGIDPSRDIYNLYASQFIPRNFLIDRDGTVVAYTTGYVESEFDHLIEKIAQTLE